MRQPVPFGKYLLLDRVSVGGMAEVFKAKSYGVEGFEKIIAIKRILPTMGEDRDFIKMFIDEAKIAGQLAHANICQIFELGRIDGSHFIAMEYIWGKDLLQIQNRLRKNKVQMPVPMACFAIAKVLEGLDYAHRKRDPLGRPLEIVHRDCSPQNVLVSYEGEVKVIDFGIAKATSRNSRTMAGVLKGKFGYMSPEQVRGLPLDRRSDIFAIGTMLYECMTGERLFQGETDFSTLEKVRNVDIQAPRAINPNIPEAIEKVILKALAKDVDDRYQWCSEMLADLQQFLMAQDVVFTAKTLSGWLKEQFSPEIERERGLLEQYKKVGRDGLIQGLPSAQAKLDVNEHLGAAGAPEGDSTILGGPDFATMEHGVGASPDVSQSPAAGGPRGAAPKKPGPAPAPVAAAPKPGFQKAADDDDDDDGEFGEEAPTEIFGDDPAAIAPPPPAAAARAPSARDLSQPLGKMPVKGPPGAAPGRPSTQRPIPEPTGPIPNQSMAAAGMRSGAASTDGLAAAGGQPSSNMGYQQPFGTPQGQPAMGGMGVGTPGGMPSSGMADSQNQGEPQRTVLGMSAPILGNYGAPGAPPFRPSGQQAAVAPPTGSNPGYSPGGYPQQPPQNPSYPNFPQPYDQQQPYGQQESYGQAAAAVDPMAVAPAEGKKSTLWRDIGIGVGIAALVLIGFVVVKMFVLDDGSKTTKTASPGKFATVKLSMPPAMSAEMFVDGTRVGTVAHDQTVGVLAGVKHIKLVGNNGLTCDDEKVKLEPGKITTLECGFNAVSGSGATGSAGSAAVTNGTGSGSAEVPAGSGSATKTGDVKTGDVKAGDTKTGDVKTGDTKTGDVKTGDTKTGDTKTGTGSGSVKAGTGTGSGSTVKTGTGTTVKTGTGSGSGAGTKVKNPGDSKDDPTKGYLQVFSKPQAKILVDGNETGLKTPINGHALSLAPGKHKITFVIGDDRFSYPVMIKAGATESMTKDLQ